MSKDTSLEPSDIIRLYGTRFKIEVAFKQAIYTIATCAYHFWMAGMSPRKNHSRNQHLLKKDFWYRKSVIRKLRAYHCYLMVSCIAQRTLQILSLKYHLQVWKLFGSWIRTIRHSVLFSKQVVAMAMKNTLPVFLLNSNKNHIWVNFIMNKIDIDRAEGARIVV